MRLASGLNLALAQMSPPGRETDHTALAARAKRCAHAERILARAFAEGISMRKLLPPSFAALLGLVVMASVTSALDLPHGSQCSCWDSCNQTCFIRQHTEICDLWCAKTTQSASSGVPPIRAFSIGTRSSAPSKLVPAAKNLSR